MRASSSLLIIGGTTASGKSALAIRLAERLKGVVVNADSVQLFKDLPILTARPDADDEARVPHRLYGVLEAHETTSAALWLDLLAPVFAAIRGERRTTILVGGTGLYISSLINGLAPVPDISREVREAVRNLPAEALREALLEEDPVMAARLEPQDRQRQMRALEVIRTTGRSLACWQKDSPKLMELDGPARGVALLPPRDSLRQRIAERMRRMMEQGALAEVRELRCRVGDPLRLPIAKAHGLSELLAMLDGKMEGGQAVERAAVRIGQYAKRQSTWFRHKLPMLKPIHAFGETDEALAKALAHLSRP